MGDKSALNPYTRTREEDDQYTNDDDSCTEGGSNTPRGVGGAELPALLDPEKMCQAQERNFTRSLLAPAQGQARENAPQHANISYSHRSDEGKRDNAKVGNTEYLAEKMESIRRKFAAHTRMVNRVGIGMPEPLSDQTKRNRVSRDAMLLSAVDTLLEAQYLVLLQYWPDLIEVNSESLCFSLKS